MPNKASQAGWKEGSLGSATGYSLVDGTSSETSPAAAGPQVNRQGREAAQVEPVRVSEDA